MQLGNVQKYLQIASNLLLFVLRPLSIQFTALILFDLKSILNEKNWSRNVNFANCFLRFLIYLLLISIFTYMLYLLQQSADLCSKYSAKADQVGMGAARFFIKYMKINYIQDGTENLTQAFANQQTLASSRSNIKTP